MPARNALIGTLAASFALAAVPAVTYPASVKEQQQTNCVEQLSGQAPKNPERAAECRKSVHKTVAGVSALLAGIPQEGTRLGKPNAPVTVEEFEDLECPSCAYFALNTLPTVIKELVRTGKIDLEFHSFQSYTLEGAIFKEQQLAALAAGQQNKLWYYTELLYHEQGGEYTGYVTESYLDGIAKQVPGLNYSAWMAARSDASLTQEIEADARTAEGYAQWKSTPVFILKEGPVEIPFYPPSDRPSAFIESIQQFEIYAKERAAVIEHQSAGGAALVYGRRAQAL